MADELASREAVRVEDNPGQNRYEVFFDGSLAGFVDYRSTPKVIILLHTEVDPVFEGHGLASALARVALDSARSHGQRVIARCPFMARFIDRHPEYADLVATRPTRPE